MQRRAIRYGAAVASATIAAIYCAISARPWASQSEAQRAEMIRAVYARVDVEGPTFVAAHLTPDARELGLTVALPEELLWRPRQDSNLRPAA